MAPAMALAGASEALAERDFYEVLGVARDASADEIKRAYRAVARKLHPDVNDAPDAAERFAEAQQAYAVLSDEEQRRSYDRYGRAGPGGAGWSSAGAGGMDVDLGDLSDLFGTFFGNRGGGGGGPFGGGARTAGRARPASRRGQDASATLRVPWMRMVEGGVETLRVKRGGQEKRIEVRVPAGVADGAKLRVRGEGNPGINGGPAGDLILAVEVDRHPVLRRREGASLDLELDLPLTIAEAAVGTAVEVPTATGSATLRVPAGTASGKRLRLRGAGLSGEKGASGDLYALVQIVPPAEVSEEDAEVLRAIAGSGDGLRSGAGWPAR